jgi:hypothetical protein
VSAEAFVESKGISYEIDSGLCPQCDPLSRISEEISEL